MWFMQEELFCCSENEEAVEKIENPQMFQGYF